MPYLRALNFRTHIPKDQQSNKNGAGGKVFVLMVFNISHELLRSFFQMADQKQIEDAEASMTEKLMKMAMTDIYGFVQSVDNPWTWVLKDPEKYVRAMGKMAADIMELQRENALLNAKVDYLRDHIKENKAKAKDV